MVREFSKTDLEAAVKVAVEVDKMICESLSIPYTDTFQVEVNIDEVNKLLRDIDLDFVDDDLIFDENTIFTIKN